MWWLIALLFCTGTGRALADSPSLTGDLGNYDAYFLGNGELRHLREALELKQVTPISSRLKTVIDGRAWLDLGASNLSIFPGHTYSPTVRSDEVFEAEGREAYLDWLTQEMRVRAGLQTINWSESLTPFTNDFITAIDLRRGAYESLQTILVPMLSLDLNHPFLGGSLEWLVVPLPKSSQFPVGENGYGYYSYLTELTGVPGLPVVNAGIPVRLEDVEFGARYLVNIRDIDFTLLAYRGHARTPALTLENTASGPTLVENFPLLVTLGAFAAYSDGPWVARLLAFAEPYRAPELVEVAGNGTFARRFRVGLGFDYLFSRALKLYSEVLFTQVDTYGAGIDGGNTLLETDRDFITTLRLTNESLHNVLFALNATLTAGNFSFLITPEVDAQLTPKLKLVAGAHLVHSDSVRSDFEPLKNTSQLFSQLTYFFSLF